MTTSSDRPAPTTPSHERVRFNAVGRLALGAQPTTQWAAVFSNPDLMHMPALRCKAFAVWFPTMIDFVRDAWPDLQALRADAHAGHVDCGQVFELAEALHDHFAQLLGLLSRDEQIFIRDRRLQNVHGMLHVFFAEQVDVRWFDPTRRQVVVERLAADDYHDIMRRFYPRMMEHELRLLTRVVQAPQWVAFGQYHQAHLTTDALVQLAQSLGVGQVDAQALGE